MEARDLQPVSQSSMKFSRMDIIVIYYCKEISSVLTGKQCEVTIYG
jgi:hypothetical protein